MLFCLEILRKRCYSQRARCHLFLNLKKKHCRWTYLQHWLNFQENSSSEFCRLQFCIIPVNWQCIRGYCNHTTYKAVIHSCLCQDSLLIYGGQMENGTADQSLFQFNTSTLQWSKVRKEYGLNRFLCYPIHLTRQHFTYHG